MKIVEVDSRVEHLPLARPYTISYETVSAVDVVLVVARDDAGAVGLGCATPSETVTGESDAMCREALAAGRLEWLVGRDLRRLPALCRELRERAPAAPAARAAVDMALHDLLARRLGVPLVDLLGRAHDALPTSVTIGIEALEEVLRQAREHLDAGFRILKIKLGGPVADDVELLRTLRSALPPGTGLRVDPNQAYAPDEVGPFLTATRDLELELVEQPVPAEALHELATLPEDARSILVADESLIGESDALALACPPRPCDVFNVKLMKCGGVRAAGRIATIAEAAGVALMWGCMDESRIGIAAALHVALASPATRYLDLDGSFDLARDLVDGGFVLEAGTLRPTGEPGLGVTLLEP